jgi:hypothetical protein
MREQTLWARAFKEGHLEVVLKDGLHRLAFQFGKEDEEKGGHFWFLSAQASTGSLAAPLHCWGQAQCWVGFGAARTELTTGGRQSVRNKETTGKQKRYPWGLLVDSRTCPKPAFLTSETRLYPPSFWSSHPLRHALCSENPKLPAFYTCAQDTNPRKKVCSLSPFTFPMRHRQPQAVLMSWRGPVKDKQARPGDLCASEGLASWQGRCWVVCPLRSIRASFSPSADLSLILGTGEVEA